MKKRTIAKIFVIMLITFLINITTIYANGATVNLSNTTVNAGDTVELNILLSTESTAYDIMIEPLTNSNLIENSEIVSKIGEGTSSRIYLVQLASQSDRKVYASGTQIAKIKYKISNNAKTGDKITISIKGDIAGKTSTEKNTMDETVTITVGEGAKTSPAEQITNNNSNPASQTNNNSNPASQTNNNNSNPTSQTNNNNSNSTSQNDNNKSASIASTKFPKAGNEKNYIMIITGVVIIQLVIITIIYKKSKRG